MKHVIAMTVGAVCLASNVVAASLDFSDLSGFQGTNELALDHATITTSGTDIFVFSEGQGTNAPGANGGFCGVSGIRCDFDSTISFNAAIKNLSFTSNQWHHGDLATASIFAGSTLLSSIDINSDRTVSFAGFSGITSLVIDDKSQYGYGMAFGDFLFDFDRPDIIDGGPDGNAPAVPLPAPVALLGAGIAALFGLRRRKA